MDTYERYPNTLNHYGAGKRSRIFLNHAASTRTDYSQTSDTYLEQLDEMFSAAEESAGYTPYSASSDLVSLVFSGQRASSAVTSQQLSDLVLERRTLNERHLKDVEKRLEEAIAKRPLPIKYPADPQGHAQQWNQAQKLVLDLERQQRDLQVTLWRDLLDLRKALLEERREHRALNRRMQFLGGGYGDTV